MIPYQTSKEIEKAVVFLVQAISMSGNNPKPVILHSILVGLSLAKFNYPPIIEKLANALGVSASELLK